MSIKRMFRRELVRDRSGRPIVGCESGEGDLKIFVAAGAHGDEPAGVLAALRLVARFREPEFRFRRVPIRDPAGHIGFLTILRELTDEQPPEEYEKLREFIAKHGREIYDDGTLLLADFDRVIIAIAPPEDDRGEDAINDRIATAMNESTTVYEELLGRHIFMPANQPHSEGVGLYGKGFTSYVSKSGRLANYNRFFGDPEAPPEVKAVQEFLDEFKPHYTIDMHEGYDDCFYVVLDELNDGIDYLLAKPNVTALRICSKEELIKNHEGVEAPRDGVILYRLPDSLAGYATRYGHAITTETGLKAPLQKRITAHMQAFFHLLEVAKIEDKVRSVEEIAMKTMKEWPDDHNRSHIERVKKLSMRTSKRLGADAFVVYLAAILHDIASEIDRENHAAVGAKMAKELLDKVGLDEYSDVVAKIISEHSRRGNPSTKESLALKIADLLDATGYIGAYRSIVYGARKGRDLRGFIEHAEEKLLKIYDRIASRTDDEEILKEAKKRHEELKTFVDGLRDESL